MKFFLAFRSRPRRLPILLEVIVFLSAILSCPPSAYISATDHEEKRRRRIIGLNYSVYQKKGTNDINGKDRECSDKRIDFHRIVLRENFDDSFVITKHEKKFVMQMFTNIEMRQKRTKMRNEYE